MQHFFYILFHGIGVFHKAFKTFINASDSADAMGFLKVKSLDISNDQLRNIASYIRHTSHHTIHGNNVNEP